MTGCFFLYPVLASAQVSLTLGDATIAAGASRSIAAVVATDGSAVALQFDVLYDPTLVSVGTVNGGAALTANHSISSNPIGPGRDRVVITTSPVTALGSAALATINLAVAGSAPAGTTALSFDGVVISDASALPITPSALTPGTITITAAAAAPSGSGPETIPATPFWTLLLLIGLITAAVGRTRERLQGVPALSIVALAMFISAPMSHAQNIPGDANGDGRIDIDDVRLIVERILERGTLTGDGDCNRDLTINVLDTVCSQIPFVPGETAPIILGPGDRSIPASVAFEMNLFAADPDVASTLSWELISGPAGLGVSTAGVLTWTPAAGDAGVNPVSIRVTDNTARADEADFDVTVFVLPVAPLANAAPVLTVPGNQALPVGTPLSVLASASDPDVGDNLTFALINGPAGMSIDSATGALSWTPQQTQAGAVDVVIEVTDSQGASDFGSFVVQATPLNAGPTAVDDVYIARKGETLVIPAPDGVTQNDSDPNGDTLIATRLSDSRIGTVDSFGTDGGFSYTPSEPERITIGLELKCETDISDFATHAGTASAADVDGDGDVELVGFSNSVLGSSIFVVDPTDCSAEANPIPAESGQPSASTLATLVNLDDDPELEVVAMYSRFSQSLVDLGAGTPVNRLMAFNIDGSPVEAWPVAGGLSDSHSFSTAFFSAPWLDASPVAADLNGDGNAALLVGYTQAADSLGTCRAVTQGASCNGVVAWDGRSGAVLWEFIGGVTSPSQRSMTPTLVDLDMDGDTEIIWNQLVLDHEGNLLFELPSERTIPARGGDLYGNPILTVAIGNFDNDAFPEIVGFDANNYYLFSHDGREVWRRSYNSGQFSGGQGGLTLAELDGDPFPELVTINWGDGDGRFTLRAFDSDGEPLWSQLDFAAQTPTFLRTSIPVAIDLDRDGIDEIIHFKDGSVANSAADSGLYIIDGATGAVIDAIADSPLGVYVDAMDEPLTVADIDGDGSVEIVTNFNREFGFDRLQIWDNLPGQPFPPGRPIRSQTNVQPTWVNADGSLPTSLAPHWLQPGRNYWNRVVPDLDPLEPQQDSFTYRVNDGTFDSNVATVNIEVRPNGNPPFFLSDPVTGTSRGVAYRYVPFTVDVDPGDVVTYELAAGPTGMTLDPATGQIDWYPDAAGDYPVSILATDTLGLSSAQIFRITVGDPVIVPDVVGQTEGAAEATLTGASLNKGQVFFASHPSIASGVVIEQFPDAGAVADISSPVGLTLSLGAMPLDRDDDSDGFSENEGDCNDDNIAIFPGAADANGDGVDQDCDGIDGNKTLVAIELAPDSKRVLVNQPTPLTATGIFDDGTAQNLTEIVTWTRGPTFFSAATGDFTAEASFRGITGIANFNVVDRVVEDLAPVALIDTPTAGGDVTAPTDVVGVASDANILRWELAYQQDGQGEFVVFAESEASVGSVGNPMALGQFDPTTLLNGVYNIRLRVYDRGGNVSEDRTTVLIDSQLKVGNFTLQYVDLELPLNGIPITITRNYDSRDKRIGDFGVGWRLGVNSIEVRTNRELGTGWQVFRQGLTYALTETDAHIVAIRLPGGRIEAFEMVVGPQISPIVPFPPFSQSVSFVPLPGTLGALRSLEANNISILDAQPGPVSLRLDGSGDVYNPTLFRYTSENGVEFDVDVKKGIQRVVTASGQSLTFTPTAITHSNGESVGLQRDDLGRITSITDPSLQRNEYRYDAGGNLVTHRDRDANESQFTYDSYHNLLKITDPLGRLVLRNDYDEKGRLVATTNGNGRSVQYEHRVDRREELVTDEDGSVLLVEYDSRGNALRTTDALGNIRTNTYDIAGNQLSSTNSLGQTTVRTFDSQNNLLSVEDPLGNTTTYEYDEMQNLASMTDALGRVTLYHHDVRGNLVSEIDPLGGETKHVYDANNNRVLTVNALDQKTEMEYDTRGRLVARRDARGVLETFEYDENGNRVAHENGRGFTSRVEVNADGLPTRTIDPLGNVRRFVRDTNGNILQTIDPLGGTSISEVGPLGEEVAFVDAIGDRFERGYDTRGNLAEMSSVNGDTTELIYDRLNRVAGFKDAQGGVNGPIFDEANRVIAHVDQLGNQKEFTYDAAGRRTQIVDALGNALTLTYDAVGNVVSQEDANGHVYLFEYDALNRLTVTHYPDGTFRLTEYDPLGQIVGQIDQLGRRTTRVYDAVGNLSSVTDAMGGVTSFEYDSVGNRIARTDANGHITRYQFDANNRLVREILPDGTAFSWKYDANGNRVEQVDGRGNPANFSYDAVGRVTKKQLADGSEVQYQYTGTRLGSIVDNRGTTTFTHDANNRVRLISNPDGSSIQYEYDAVGNLLTTTAELPGESPLVFSNAYDVANRLQSVADAEGNVSTYDYDAAGNLTALHNSNGVDTTYEYDQLNRLIAIEHRSGGQAIAGYAYTLDAVGNRIRVDSLDGSSVAYVYDDLDRLLRETHRNLTGTVFVDLSYEYDAVGNRLSMTDELSSFVTSYTYDASDKLLTAGAVTFTYDANGNLTSRTAALGVSSFSYDLENRMVESRTDVIESFTYDDFGNRVSLTSDARDVTYLIDTVSNTGFPQVLVEYDGVADQLYSYTFGLDLISRTGPGGRLHYQYDGINSTRLLTDENGLVAGRYDYEGYGDLLNASGPSDNAHLFTGERQDSGSGLYYLRARYYSVATGRFVSRDPFRGRERDPASLHRYTYTVNNPIRFVDYSGLLAADTIASMKIAASLSATITSLVILNEARDPRNLATWNTTRVVYRLASSVILGAVSGYISAGAAASAALTAETAVLGTPAFNALQQAAEFAINYGFRSVAIGSFTALSCLGDKFLFSDVTRAGVESCASQGVVSASIFTAFGAADAVRLFKDLGPALGQGGWIDDVVSQGANTVGAILEPIIDEYLPSPEEMERFVLGVVGLDAPESEKDAMVEAGNALR